MNHGREKIKEMLKTYFNWSSGKDSSLALYQLLNSNEYSVEKLLTTISFEEQRVGMHGLRKELLEKQVQSIGLPHQIIELKSSLSHENYNKLMAKTNEELKNQGFTHAAFGDIFLEDLKNYREAQLKLMHIEAVFPLWQRNTKEVIHEFIDLGFRTVIVAASKQYFDKSFVGQELTKDLIDNLPSDVDPCGENGEFHTFTFEGPIFKEKIDFKEGEKVLKTYPNPSRNKDSKSDVGFWFCDLIPI